MAFKAASKIGFKMTKYMPGKLRPKFLEVLRYKLLYRLFSRKMLLEQSRFKGKTVLLAGPARTLSDDLSPWSADDFDLVVKMNNGLWVDLPFGTGNSQRCDVLFHSLTDDIPAVTSAALAAADVRCLVHRTTGKGRFPITLWAARSWGTENRVVRIVDPDSYRKLTKRLEGASPTTGLVCLDFLLKSGAKKVVIAGFTFFQTKYQDGYDERDQTDQDTVQRVKSLSHHDPDKEREVVARLVAEARKAGTEVVLGPCVETALQGRLIDNQDLVS
ncbi:hypothetical protein [Tritonibacter multivorans]|nr:hypothetical protein [Tritonibacter multivorans]